MPGLLPWAQLADDSPDLRERAGLLAIAREICRVWELRVQIIRLREQRRRPIGAYAPAPGWLPDSPLGRMGTDATPGVPRRRSRRAGNPRAKCDTPSNNCVVSEGTQTSETDADDQASPEEEDAAALRRGRAGADGSHLDQIAKGQGDDPSEEKSQKRIGGKQRVMRTMMLAIACIFVVSGGEPHATIQVARLAPRARGKRASAGMRLAGIHPVIIGTSDAISSAAYRCRGAQRPAEEMRLCAHAWTTTRESHKSTTREQRASKVRLSTSKHRIAARASPHLI